MLSSLLGSLAAELWGPWLWLPTSFSSCLLIPARFIACYASKQGQSDQILSPGPIHSQSLDPVKAPETEREWPEKQINTTLDILGFLEASGFVCVSMSFCTATSSGQIDPLISIVLYKYQLQLRTGWPQHLLSSCCVSWGQTPHLHLYSHFNSLSPASSLGSFLPFSLPPPASHFSWALLQGEVKFNIFYRSSQVSAELPRCSVRTELSAKLHDWIFVPCLSQRHGGPCPLQEGLDQAHHSAFTNHL